MWEYEVRPEQQKAFRRAYGPDGEWAALFARHPGWISTDLFVNLADGDRFVTIDRWLDEQSWQGFLASWLPEYDDLDRRLRSLMVAEGPLAV